MSAVRTPLLGGEIEADEVVGNINSTPTSNNARPVVLTPTNRATEQMATTESDAEAGIAGIFRQSAHPVALLFLFLFRIGAITVYLLSGFVTENYVLSTVAVVVLLAMDFWNCRNVAGRTLVGLRFWNQVDEDGESFWVFESRDPSRPANPVDSRMFWIAIYVFPLLWVALFIVSLLRLKLTFIPIVILALVFNVTNAVGFTYADRDAKQRWANSVVSSGWSLGLGGIGGQLVSSAVQKSVGRVFGS
ncbi:Golgi apparatus membrane protein TVP23 [Mycena alexandri]|uniref:Golgi apparatus membrane protein TVP23 n=1 Tax=Mycena alexandri TaxID=1745969 RepID=A0AAD6SER1_9AGAR|nr:Golgi apparatus membrane protein TVP23 [Mycena alexandri]